MSGRSGIWQEYLGVSRIRDMLETRATLIFPFTHIEWENTFYSAQSPLNIRTRPPSTPG